MIMGENEILRDYHEAANKFNQVKVLAQLNLVSNKEMAIWLREHGEQVDTRFFPEERMKKKNKTGSNVPEPTEMPPVPKSVKPPCEELDAKMEQADQAAKQDAGKFRPSLLEPELFEEVAKVREHGVEKYGDKDNWKKVSADRYHDALLRHALACLHDVYAVDEESGLLHLSHICCNAMFLLSMRRDKP